MALIPHLSSILQLLGLDNFLVEWKIFSGAVGPRGLGMLIRGHWLEGVSYISGRAFGSVSETHGFWRDFSDIAHLHLYCSKLLSLQAFSSSSLSLWKYISSWEEQMDTSLQAWRRISFVSLSYKQAGFRTWSLPLFWKPSYAFSQGTTLSGVVARYFLFMCAVMVQWVYRICASNTFSSDCRCPACSLLGESGY